LNDFHDLSYKIGGPFLGHFGHRHFLLTR